MKIDKNQTNYTLMDNSKKVNVHRERNNMAEDIDKNKDYFLEDKEIGDYLLKKNIVMGSPDIAENLPEIVGDFKQDLQKKSLSQMKEYHSYEQVISELKDLEAKYPDLAKTFSLGKTAEGREIMALKIGKDGKSDRQDKPGFLITGGIHAYEWPAMEGPARMPAKILESYSTDEKVKHRVDNAEIWILPVLNPDGYEYSRNEYSFWRKNRRPVMEKDVPQEISDIVKPDEKGVLSYGVDLNRNNYDGNPEHFWLYRFPEDNPASISDDSGVVSDDPRSDFYRGPSGASEKEIQSVIGLWLKRKNIKGIVTHHTYGKDILYPWGATHDHVHNEKVYKEIAGRMADAIKDDKYVVMQSIGYLPATGDTDDVAYINNRFGLTLEMGESYHPQGTDLDKQCRQAYDANMAFLDWLIENKEIVMKDNPPVPEKLEL